MARPKGTPKNEGRKAGTPNKLTANVEAMILAALDEAGGKAYLLRQAHENPTAFMRLLSKVLAHQISGEPEGPIEIWKTISFEEHQRQAREAIAAAFAEPKREAETEATRLPEPQGAPANHQQAPQPQRSDRGRQCERATNQSAESRVPS